METAKLPHTSLLMATRTKLSMLLRRGFPVQRHTPFSSQQVLCYQAGTA